jgi:PPK2 family polyphosphate:nucleotide phosphotransferase
MLARRFDEESTVRLTAIDPDDDGGLSREEAEKRLPGLLTRLGELQELLYAAGTHSLLVVLQGRDTAGKDGTLKAIAGAMNPVGTRVASFKVPTATELSHDFLWRVHAQAPARGEAVFFNRSHYEDVLVVRVHNIAPESVWKPRYEHINGFEKLLADSNTIIAKFCLHISKDEQKQRLLEREQEAEKAWKLNPGDWKERTFWDDYTAAYEDAIGKCAHKKAPWFVVPANRKWFRNIAVAEALLSVLEPYEKTWRESLDTLGKKQKAALAELGERH